MFVYAGGKLLPEDLDDIFQNSWWDGKVFVRPWNVFNNRDLY